MHLTKANGCDAVTDEFLGSINRAGQRWFAFNDAEQVPSVLLNRESRSNRGLQRRRKAADRTFACPSTFTASSGRPMRAWI